MADLTAAQKKDFAKSLFLHESLTQDEIALRTGASRRTIQRWMEADNRKELKASVTITREEQVRNLYRQLAGLNDAIAKKEKGARYATASEADTISKLATAIQKMETDAGIADIVSVSKGLLNFIRKTDPEKAIEISYHIDAYIKEKISR
jgi:transcriptional regulator with XRE-family HTH domain